MSDKTKELNRINDPRVRRILDQLTFIEKSAGSLRAHELDVVTLLKPVATKLAQMQDADAVAFEATGELAPAQILPREWMSLPDAPRRGEENDGELAPASVEVAATPPVAREMGDLQELSTQQLVDRMIACGALLAERRK